MKKPESIPNAQDSTPKVEIFCGLFADWELRIGSWRLSPWLSSSALATATAVTALAVARRANVAPASDDALVQEGVRWLVTHVNTDGGWGDTPDSVSNISTTALVWAALAFGPAE